jgi:hypothetical protein
MNYSVQINLNLIFYQTKIPTLFLYLEYNKERFTWFICNTYLRFAVQCIIFNSGNQTELLFNHFN